MRNFRVLPWRHVAAPAAARQYLFPLFSSARLSLVRHIKISLAFGGLGASRLRVALPDSEELLDRVSPNKKTGSSGRICRGRAAQPQRIHNSNLEYSPRIAIEATSPAENQVQQAPRSGLAGFLPVRWLRDAASF